MSCCSESTISEIVIDSNDSGNTEKKDTDNNEKSCNDKDCCDDNCCCLISGLFFVLDDPYSDHAHGSFFPGRNHNYYGLVGFNYRNQLLHPPTF